MWELKHNLLQELSHSRIQYKFLLYLELPHRLIYAVQSLTFRNRRCASVLSRPLSIRLPCWSGCCCVAFRALCLCNAGSCAACAGSLVKVCAASTFVPVIAVFGRPFGCCACVVVGVNIAVFLFAGGAYCLCCTGSCAAVSCDIQLLFAACALVPVICSVG